MSCLSGDAVHCIVDFFPPQSNQVDTTSLLYFHRNRFSRSNPREFWGFLSINPDPCAPGTGSDRLGWTCRYSVYVDLWTLVYCLLGLTEFNLHFISQDGLDLLHGGLLGPQVLVPTTSVEKSHVISCKLITLVSYHASCRRNRVFCL
jgi:hypothetical protein